MSTIELRAVNKRFGQLAALDDIDLDVASGEFVTLLGPSGCGKTTLLRVVAGLEQPSTGEVRVDGEAPEIARQGKRIGFVPQAPALLPWRTVRKNAILLRQVNRRVRVPAAAPDPLELLEEVGLGAFLDALPHELSGGMQQRVALVRAFALGAPLLLMDEPFAALDEITRADMRHLLGRLCERTGAAVVFVTHSIAEAVFLSDRVAVMTPRPGRIAGAVEIDLPRPRLAEVEDRPEFFRHETALRAMLHAGAAAR